jgi:hypothetical protein
MAISIMKWFQLPNYEGNQYLHELCGLMNTPSVPIFAVLVFARHQLLMMDIAAANMFKRWHRLQGLIDD